MLTDREFLLWIHDRLQYVHKENPNVDYMHRLRAIIDDMEPTKTIKMRCMPLIKEKIKG